MAEATTLRNAALPFPVYGAPYAVVFPLLDADGDPISPSSPDSERSLNGDTFADCTNEATEIATSSGICYLALTAAEMTADIVALRIQSTGAKTTVMTLYPRKLVTIRSGTAADDGSGTSSIVLDAGASAVDDFYNGMLIVADLDGTVEARIIRDYTGSTKACSVTPDFTIAPDNTDTFTIYLVEGAQLNQANVTHFGGAAGTFSSGRPEVNTSHIAGSSVSTSSAQIGVNVVNAGGTAWASGAITAAVIATGAIDADAIADNAIDAGALAADCITADKIAAGAIDAATFAADVDAEILSYIVDDATRIDASDLNSKIDSLTFGVSGKVDANITHVNEVEVTGDGDGTPWGPV